MASISRDFATRCLRPQTAREAGPRDRADAVMELEQVKKLVDRLASSLSDQEASKKLIEQIWFYLERLQDRFRP